MGFECDLLYPSQRHKVPKQIRHFPYCIWFPGTLRAPHINKMRITTLSFYSLQKKQPSVLLLTWSQLPLVVKHTAESLKATLAIRTSTFLHRSHLHNETRKQKMSLYCSAFPHSQAFEFSFSFQYYPEAVFWSAAGEEDLRTDDTFSIPLNKQSRTPDIVTFP